MDKKEQVIVKIEALSKDWDLDGLMALAESHGKDACAEIQEEFADAFSYHLGELAMADAAGKLEGDEKDNLEEMLALLDWLYFFVPDEESLLFQARLRTELANLESGVSAQQEYMQVALYKIEQGLATKPSAALWVGKTELLADWLEIPAQRFAQLCREWETSLDKTLSLLSPTNTPAICKLIYNLRCNAAVLPTEIIQTAYKRFSSAISALSEKDSSVLMKHTRCLAIAIAGHQPEDEEMLLRLFSLIDEMLILPNADENLLDDCIREIRNILRQNEYPLPNEKKDVLRHRIRLLSDLHIRFFPGSLRAYENKTDAHLQLAGVALAISDTARAANDLQSAIHFLENVDPDDKAKEDLYCSRLKLMRLYNQKILKFSDRAYNLQTLELMQKSQQARVASYKRVFNNREVDYYAAYFQEDFVEIIEMQLRVDDPDAAWATVLAWQKVRKRQEELWKYPIRKITEALTDAKYEALHSRLEMLEE
jgi:predicted transcriptional regulator YdeE